MDFLEDIIAKAPDLPPEGEPEAPKPKRQRWAGSGRGRVVEAGGVVLARTVGWVGGCLSYHKPGGARGANTQAAEVGGQVEDLLGVPGKGGNKGELGDKTVGAKQVAGTAFGRGQRGARGSWLTGKRPYYHRRGEATAPSA
jgi:hypothetical protein